MHDIITTLTQPAQVYSRAEVLQRPCPVPRAKGVYAWFFRSYPAIIPAHACVTLNSLTLLYVGISPKAPSSDGLSVSSQDLSKRIRYHYRGNAEGSTLRLTLGVLLDEELGIELRGVGSGTRKTFTHAGEAALSQWLISSTTPTIARLE